jgi:MscS family membrane protein
VFTASGSRRKIWGATSGKRPGQDPSSLSFTVVLFLVVMALGSTFLWTSPGTVFASTDLHPLAPPDTSSPRATLQTFLDEMNKAVELFKTGHRHQAFNTMRRVERCLNLEAEPPAIRLVLGFYAALCLKETLDRIEIPPFEDIPDSKVVEAQKLSSWTVPYTEITMAAVDDGPAGRKFLFTPDTLSHSADFYRKVQNLPYKPGASGALYERLSSTAGPMIPKQIMDLVPRWAQAMVLGQALWQWLGLVLYVAVGGAAVLLVHRCAGGALGLIDAKIDSDLTHTVGGLLLPALLILFAQAGLTFVVYGLHFRDADVYLAIAFMLLSISYAGIIWLIAAILSRAASVVIAIGRLEPGGMQAQLIRFGFDIVTVVIVAGAAISLGARMGLPTYSLVTGLGVGGLAVALAGREALSNVIGTVAILIDQPFKVGDFIVLGETDRGTVTEIGLRSTRIRTRDGILVSIPNSNIANMKITNESAPAAEARIHVPVGVPYGSSVNEVEQALLAACQMCEYVVSKPAPSVRLCKFGDSAVDFELLVWISRPELRSRATDQLNRAIIEELRKRGIEMPFPQREVRILADR